MRKHDTTGERLGEQLPTSAIGHMVIIIFRSRRHRYFISYFSVDREHVNCNDFTHMYLGIVVK